MNDILEKVIEQEQERITLYNYPGNIFYLSTSIHWLTDDQISRYGLCHPYSMIFIKGGTGHGEIAAEAGLGDLVMEQLNEMKEKWIAQHRSEVRQQLRKLNQWLDQHPIEYLPTDVSGLCKVLQEAARVLIDVNLTFHVAISVDQYFERKKQDLRRSSDLQLSSEDLAALTVSHEPAAVMVHDSLVLDLVKLIRENNMIEADLDQVRSNQEIRAALERCFQAGYFLNSGYGGVRIWNLSNEWHIVQQAARNPHQLEEQVIQRRENSSFLEHLNKTLDLPPEVGFWFEASRYFSYLRDQRKTIQQKIFYWHAVCLEKIAPAIGRSRAQLEKLEFTEINQATFNDKKRLDWIIKERTQAYMWCWSPQTGHLRWQGAEAENSYQKYSLQVKKIAAAAGKIKALKGVTASGGVARGKVRIIFNPLHAGEYIEGSVLVTGMTSPDFVPLMKLSAAIVTELGGVTCHAAIISRELRKPCVIDTKTATQVLKDGDEVEVDADRGIVKVLKKNSG